MSIYYKYDDFLKFIVVFAIFILSGTAILFGEGFVEYTELLKDITYCICGISFIATIYNAIMLHKSRIETK